jgi:hypothetical protein
MGEQLPQPETLDTIQLDGRSLSQWHAYLTTDETGADAGHLTVPCSRYGRTSDECAYWAIALEIIYVEANGEDHHTTAALDYLMELVVNDHDDPAELVRDYGYCLPGALVEVLELPDE